MGGKPQRLFVAISLPEVVQTKLTEISQEIAGTRWLQAPQRHLTLKFIGDVVSHRLTTVQGVLQNIGHRAFPLNLKGLGVFPLLGKPRILWIGMVNEPALMELQGKIEHGLARAGVCPAEPRVFEPHITLARFKNFNSQQMMAYLDKHQSFVLEEFRVDCYHLFASELNRDGAVHKILQTYELSNSEF